MQNEASPAPGAPAYAVGATLKSARERLGKELPDVATQLRIRQPFLQALEDGRHKDLPGGAYAVGFLRTYAEFLGLDGEEMVRRFRAEAAGEFDGRAELLFPSPVSEGRIPGGAVLFMGLLLAGMAYGAWYFLSARHESNVAEMVPPLPDRLSNVLNRPATLTGEAPKAEEAKPAEPPKAEDAAAPATPGQPAKETEMVPPPEEEEAKPTAAPAIAKVEPPKAPEAVKTEPVKAEPAKVEPPKPEPAKTEPAKPVEVAKVEPPKAPEPAKAPEPVKPVETPKPAAPAAAPAPAVATPAPAPAVQAPAPAPTPAVTPATPAPEGKVWGSENTDSRVTLKAANDDCWVQVREMNGQLLLSRLLRRGDSYQVPNRPGLTLMVGNAGALDVSVDGKKAPALGTTGQVRRDIKLDADKLTTGG